VIVLLPKGAALEGLQPQQAVMVGQRLGHG
jgi:hypothetical protein